MGRPGRYERQRAKQQNAQLRLENQLKAARTDKQQHKQKQTSTDKASERREQISTDIIAAIADTAARTAAATAKAIFEQQQGTTLQVQDKEPQHHNRANPQHNHAKPVGGKPQVEKPTTGGKPRVDKPKAGGKPAQRNIRGQAVDKKGRTLFDRIRK
jgi:ATP/maltotriose-dependent transcriptional regulator MalT